MLSHSKKAANRIADRIAAAETQYTNSRKRVNVFLAAKLDNPPDAVWLFLEFSKGLLKSFRIYCLYKVFAVTSPMIRNRPYRVGKGKGLPFFLLK